MNCKDCNYFLLCDEDARERCHWESRCPGDVPPCEEEEDSIYD